MLSTVRSDYLAHLLMRTPLEAPARVLRRLVRLGKGWRHRELREVYSEPEAVDACVRRILGPGEFGVDVGCHLGSMLALFLKASPGVRHIGFEAVPYKADWLRKKFPEAEIRAVAVGAEAGQATFFVQRTGSSYSSLFPGATDLKDDADEITVDVTRLDDALADVSAIRLLKVDVEGAELAVLQGACEVFARHRPVLLFESTMTGLQAAGLRPEQVYEFVDGTLGYSVYRPCDALTGGQPLSEAQFAAAHVYPYQAFNFFAWPKDTPQDRRWSRG